MKPVYPCSKKQHVNIHGKAFVKVHRKKKQKGKREDNLKGIPVTVVQHEMTDDELKAAFPDGKYKRLPDEVYKRLEFHPASFEVMEHHVAV